MAARKKSHLQLVKPRGALTDVQKRTANSAVVASEDEHKYLEDLRGELWAKLGDQTYKQISDKAGLSYGTVHNFAVGNTKRPSIFTVRRLAKAVGLELVLSLVETLKRKA